MRVMGEAGLLRYAVPALLRLRTAMTPATLPIPSEDYPEALSHPQAAAHAQAAGREESLASPGRYARVLLIAMLLGSTFRNYWTNSHYEHLDPSVWMSFVNGTGAAPEQYRVGVKQVAWWIMRHLGGGFRHSFALLDIVGSVIAALLLYSLLERSRFYREGGLLRRWFGSGVFLVLFFYYLSWLPWFEKAETLPSAGLVAGLLWLWSKRPGSTSGLRIALTVAGLLLLTMGQALVRADIALLLSAGMFLVALTRRFGDGHSLPQPWALGTSVACALLAAGTQAYMMRVAYPHASYGDTPVFMLRYDIADPLVVGPFVLFLLPVVWTALAALRQLRAGGSSSRFVNEDAAGLGLLLGALLYIPLWMVLGKLDEVRIFLPFALALVPLSTGLVLRRVLGHGEEVVSDEPVEFGAGQTAGLSTSLRFGRDDASVTEPGKLAGCDAR